MTPTLATLLALAPRNLDAVAAEVVCGWKWESGYPFLGVAPFFSSDLNAANSLVPLVLACRKELSSFTTREFKDGSTWAMFCESHGVEHHHVHSDSLATAITICCILAKQQTLAEK